MVIIKPPERPRTEEIELQIFLEVGRLLQRVDCTKLQVDRKNTVYHWLFIDSYFNLYLRVRNIVALYCHRFCILGKFLEFQSFSVMLLTFLSKLGWLYEATKHRLP